jgi:hypothetical protein
MAAGPDGRWEIGIGDPTPLGWITVAAYAAAAVLAWRNAGAARRTAVPHSFWIALTALMLALGINKQLVDAAQALAPQTRQRLARCVQHAFERALQLGDVDQRAALEQRVHLVERADGLAAGQQQCLVTVVDAAGQRGTDGKALLDGGKGCIGHGGPRGVGERHRSKSAPGSDRAPWRELRRLSGELEWQACGQGCDFPLGGTPRSA